MKPTMGSLFAGIGGFDLGFERAGFKTLWQVEKNAYCRRVLRRHFPDASRRVTDVRFAGARNLAPVDVICGGFPCQDISNAGLRAGIDGARSGLWFHMHRIIGELRPRYVVVENVAALLRRGMGRVLGDLATIGYDAEWHCIRASEIAADHSRDRVWILAHPHGGNDSLLQPATHIITQQSQEAFEFWRRGVYELGAGSGLCGDHAYTRAVREFHGIPARVDRLRALGNAVVPQIPEMIASRLLKEFA